MIKKINKEFILSAFVFFSWVAMWVSINALPYEIKDMTKSFINFMNGSRSIGAILFSSISLVLLFFLIIFKKIKKVSIILVLFSLYFIFQLIGLIANDAREIELGSSYLILYALGTISILMIIDIEKIHKILPYFFYFALSILTIGYLLILSQSTSNFISIFSGNIYNLLHPDEMIFFQAPPRISGLTRSFGIISLSLLIILMYRKRTKILSPIIFSLIILITMFIWIAQSRGTILCYYLTFIFFIIFLNDLSKFKKFLIIISITFFSILVSNEIVKIINKNLLMNNIFKFNNIEELEKKVQELEKKQTDKTDFTHVENITLKILQQKMNKEIDVYNKSQPFRFLEKRGGSYTSGRIVLWKNALERYEKNRIFGYGPQADRILLFNPIDFDSGNNVSNTMIYAFLSGGYFSLAILILIYIYTAYLVLNYFLVNKIFFNKFSIKKNNIFVVASINYTIFFMIRSIFENSFGVFSIDFLIVILSLFIIEKSKLKITYKF
jgi:hypothetical protein